ncbi:IS110 family transposase [Actinocrispum wychmicini]|uniref:Transposase n=1 Tax=Actinocrispum wychmicini TaxID=1213861 RepID=A0A4R2JQZ1_9PSEU|nr:transposase [Actinocrispum wychmicini]
MTARPRAFCGLDWREGHHDVAMVDQDGKLIAKRRITDDAQGFTELLDLLAEAGDSAETPIPVVLETSRGLMVAALRATGRAIYALTLAGSNSQVLHLPRFTGGSWRTAHSCS